MERRTSDYYRQNALQAYDKANSDEGREKAAALRYELAEYYLAQEDEEDALRHFKELGDYGDAAERVADIYYRRGERELAAGNPNAAAGAFREAGDYLDVADRLAQIYYDQAEALLAKQDEDGAIDAFQRAGAYKDAAQRIDAIYDARLEAYVSAGEWENAENLLRFLKKEEGIPALRYRHAVALYEAGNLLGASFIFDEMPEYIPEEGRPVAEYRQEIAAAGLIVTDWMRPGTVVTLSAFEQDGNEGNGAEPLEWIVLDSDGEKSLLITRYVIYDLWGAIREVWEDSTYRGWLKGTFYNSAFSEAEKAAILTTRIDNSRAAGDPGDYGVAGGEDTEDPVFALSYQEAMRYLR